MFSNSLLTRKKMNKLFIISCSRGYCYKIQSLLLKFTSRPVINRLQEFSLLLLSVTYFADLCKEIIYTWWEHEFYIIREISFKWLLIWQHWQEPYLEPNQKSMVKLFCKNSYDLLLLLFFRKKPCKSKAQVTSCKFRVKIHELRVQIHEFRVQVYELRVQIHELRY